ncbi:MAG: hypothetical protein ACK56F_11130 [bacterium]
MNEGSVCTDGLVCQGEEVVLKKGTEVTFDLTFTASKHVTF